MHPRGIQHENWREAYGWLHSLTRHSEVLGCGLLEVCRREALQDLRALLLRAWRKLAETEFPTEVRAQKNVHCFGNTEESDCMAPISSLMRLDLTCRQHIAWAPNLHFVLMEHVLVHVVPDLQGSLHSLNQELNVPFLRADFAVTLADPKPSTLEAWTSPVGSCNTAQNLISQWQW